MSISTLAASGGRRGGGRAGDRGSRGRTGVGAIVLGLGRRQYGRRQRPRGRALQPELPKGEVIVSFSDRRLYYVTRPGEALAYPVAAPREQSRWQGVTSVSQKRVNPSWTPTPEMMRENPRLPRWVPGGHPMNPLGVRALYLGSSMYRIHGTDAPWTIGTNVSKGCIRMYNQDVLDLYPRVNVGTKVTVTYQTLRRRGEQQPDQQRHQQQQQRRLLLQPVRQRRAAAGETAPQGDPRQERFCQERGYEECLVAIRLRPTLQFQKGGPAAALFARRAGPDPVSRADSPSAADRRCRPDVEKRANQFGNFHSLQHRWRVQAGVVMVTIRRSKCAGPRLYSALHWQVACF